MVDVIGAFWPNPICFSSARVSFHLMQVEIMFDCILIAFQHYKVA